MRVGRIGISILILAIAMFCIPQAVRAADRSYDDSTKKLIENVKNGVDRFKDKLQDKWKVEKITRSGVTTDVSDAMNDWKKSAETLKDRFKSDYAANPDANEFLQKSKKMDEFMSSHQGQTGADTEWLELRRNLVSLASAYNIDWESDPSQWKATRKTDNELKSMGQNLEQAMKTFGKSLDDAVKKSSIADDSRKDIKASAESLSKSAKMLKDAINDKKPAGGAFDGVMTAKQALASKVDSAGLTAQVSAAWSGVENVLNNLAAAFGRSM